MNLGRFLKKQPKETDSTGEMKSSKLGRDHFPDLHCWDDTLPDGESTDISEVESDDESAIAKRKEKYRSKVDQDVAVFLKLAEQMPMESLIFLLQGQAQAQQESLLGPQYQKHQKKSSKAQGKKKSLPLAPKVKSFRFAEVSNNEVRVIVHEIESITEFAEDLWFQEDEMRTFRKDAIETVRFYTKHCHDYISAVEEVFVAKDTQRIQRQFKKLAEDSYVRGFEAHIVSLLSDRRDLFCRAIIALQDEVAHESYEVSSQVIGEASERHSRLAADFAVRLAQIDHVEALKVRLSR